MRVCCYVTGHGFGHASRVQAVAQALLAARADVEVELRTTAPRAVFEWLLGPRCHYATAHLDPGVVQTDSFAHDVPATLAAWQELLRQAPDLVAAEAEHLRRSDCRVVLSDISPLACAAAKAAALPCLALGNFTWDWILEEHTPRQPGFAAIIAELRRLYATAELYLRLPMSPDEHPFRVERRLPLVARLPTRPRAEVRRALGVADAERLVLVSFGGFGVAQLDLRGASHVPGLRCVWDRPAAEPPWLLSAAGLAVHYPDLVRAADVVLTKPGYSIIAESVAAGTPLAYVPRTGFREAPLLEAFLERSWPSLRLSRAALADGRWAGAVGDWLAAGPPPLPAMPTDGAAQAAAAIGERL